MRELPLPKCIEVWGWSPFGSTQMSVEEEQKRNHNGFIPTVAPEYLKWLRSRRRICREVSSMMQLGDHPNIVKLCEVLELIQVS